MGENARSCKKNKCFKRKAKGGGVLEDRQDLFEGKKKKMQNVASLPFFLLRMMF